MRIRLKADDLGYGILLGGIKSPSDARYLRQFFASNGLDPVVNSPGVCGYQILLYGIGRDALDKLIGGADVELTT